MHVSILVPAGQSILSSIVGPYKIFSSVNQYLIDSGRSADPFYKLDLVGITDETKLYDDIFSIKPTRMVDDIQNTDLIIITTIFGDVQRELQNNARFIPWIRKMHDQKNAEVASLCVGAFLLAASGLVSGRQCSTHWSYVPLFRQMFPDVDMVPEQIITEDGGIYSSGGSYSFLNLLLYLVQKYNGKEVANWVSKMFEIEIDRTSQSPFIIFMGQKNHEDLEIKEVQSFIENNYNQALSLDDLAHRFNLSKRNLIRRFKRATHNTPHQYL
ncbi:MAG: AraC family transcriptional regulator, partial [Saprospiraceae bacterium]|nr:AraC family transcriptional regulator [Saprospiraceae bacterium]